MSETVRLLKGIMRTSGWTQEQLAAKLGVSFVSLNSWINGRSQPRKAMVEQIQKLYLAQDVTRDKLPTYVTLLNVGDDLKVEDMILLIKDVENGQDDEAIVTDDGMYVANSVDEVVRGTSSAGRIYDRFENNARAQILFVYHQMAIAKILEWDCDNQ